MRRLIVFGLSLGIAVISPAAPAASASAAPAYALTDVGTFGGPQASLDLFARAGRLGVPTVVIGDRMFDGFGAHREEIEALLRD